MANKQLKFRNGTYDVSLGQSVWIVDTNDRSKKGREYFIVSIGNKLVGFSRENDGEASVKFQFDGYESGKYHHCTVYTSKETYNEVRIMEESSNPLERFLHSSEFREKFNTLEKYEEFVAFIGFSEQFNKIKAKVNNSSQE